MSPTTLTCSTLRLVSCVSPTTDNQTLQTPLSSSLASLCDTQNLELFEFNSLISSTSLTQRHTTQGLRPWLQPLQYTRLTCLGIIRLWQSFCLVRWSSRWSSRDRSDLYTHRKRRTHSLCLPFGREQAITFQFMEETSHSWFVLERGCDCQPAPPIWRLASADVSSNRRLGPV